MVTNLRLIDDMLIKNNISSLFKACCSPLIVFLTAALLIIPCLSAASTANTVVLPLKLNARTSASMSQAKVDAALKKAADKAGLSMLERGQTSGIINYQNWPPTAAALKALPLPKGTEYIVFGSLTPLGSKISVDMRVMDLLDPAHSNFFYQDGGSAEDLSTIFTKISHRITAFTNRYSIIADIVISGNKKIDSGAIRQKIDLTAGDLYSPAKIKKAIKDIYKMGYFDNITVTSSPTDKGRRLTFHVIEKAVISQVIISGEDEIKESDIRDVITLSPNSIISNKDVQKSITSIKKLYKDKSYYNTRVAADIKKLQNGRVDVTFKIKEGHKVYIKDITFTGNKAFSAKELRKIMQTSERGWLSWLTDSGILKVNIVDQDSARMAAFYHNHGYIDARVGKPEINHKGEWIYINFNIFEGPRYRVGTVDLSGDLITDKADLIKLTKLWKEKFFSRKTLRDDVLKITDYYASKGYAFAEVTPHTERDMQNKRVNVTISIVKNKLIHINRITIKGNSRTRDKVIRREMQVKEGGIFNATALKISKQRLERLDYFEHVDITPQPTADSSEMNINVDVKEKATGNFSIGAGYSSVDSFMFMSQVSENNFLGKGQRVALKANLSGRSTEYDFSFTEPHLADSELLFGFNIYNWSRDYDNYTKKSKGVGVNFAYPVWDNWHLSFGYSFDDTKLTNLSAYTSQLILDSMNIRYTSSVRVGLGKDTLNHRINPTSGHVYSMSLKYAGGPLGGDSQFTKMEASTSWYYPLPWDTTIHNKLSAGLAFANSGNKLPVFEKYYLGGINTIRGFKASSISPRDPLTGEKIGGAKMWYYNLEYIFPLLKDAGLRGVTFFDAGNVYAEDSDWDFNDIKKSVGFGFRWRSPMGPLRLEWGYNLDPKPYEQQSNWDFTMGGTF